jgi:hypothetical protein
MCTTIGIGHIFPQVDGFWNAHALEAQLMLFQQTKQCTFASRDVACAAQINTIATRHMKLRLTNDF